MIAFVLLVLMFSALSDDHFCNAVRVTFAQLISSSPVSPEKKRLVSSAYITNLVSGFMFTISLMYILNSNGPNMLPCGTPDIIAFVEDAKLLR